MIGISFCLRCRSLAVDFDGAKSLRRASVADRFEAGAATVFSRPRRKDASTVVVDHVALAAIREACVPQVGEGIDAVYGPGYAAGRICEKIDFPCCNGD